MYTPIHTANRFRLIQSELVDSVELNRYWLDLMAKGLNKARIPEEENANIDSFIYMINDPSNTCFMIWDQKYKRFCAETMLNNAQGLCAQVHFSIHPWYHGPQAIDIARQGVEQLFQLQCSRDRQPLRTLIGLTPTNNKLAVRFIRKVGFKTFDIIKDIYYNETLKTYVDAHLSKLHVEDMYGR